MPDQPISPPVADPTLLPTPVASDADAPTQVRAKPTVALNLDGTPAVTRYELVREIARGGMGVVYFARDLALGREIAVKVMLPGMSATEFVRESQIAAKLPHPGIPPVHALGTLPDGRPFLAMKLIQGETLEKLLRGRSDPAAERGRFVAAFEQMCQAVGYAHAQGIVHRDLKPANVMVGAFGEVQVMDWGLAKVVGSADGAAAGGTAPVSEDVAATVAGQVKGTPGYMAPEQARGEPVDARADVFALGGILAAILTGKPPFVGNSVLDTIIRAAKAELDDVYARLDGCGADAELIEVAKWCLAARAEDRPADGEAVAAAVAAYRAGVDARLHQAEQDRAAAEATAAEEQNTRREAEARADAERAKGDEQRKRRRVQLVLAGVVVATLAGAGIATALVIEKQSADRLEAVRTQAEDRRAAEKKLADERFAAEQKRQADLRAAEVAAQEKQRAADVLALANQRQTRADALVQALESASTSEVPRLAADLKEFRDLTGVRLRELANRPVGERAGLHARLVLLTDDPERAVQLAAYLPMCKPDELLTIRDALKPHAGAVVPGLWAVLVDEKADSGKRVRAACALAGFAPTDERWAEVVAAVAEAVVQANPVEFVAWSAALEAWSAALEPVRGVLVPELMTRYADPEVRKVIESGKLEVSKLAGLLRRYDLTANLLALYTKDRPAELAELALIADPRHYWLFADAIEKNKAEVVPLLKAELAKAPPKNLAVDKMDAALETFGKRRGYAAAVLVSLGEGEAVWPVFAFPKDGDPTARSYLQERLAAIGADPSALVKRFEAEEDVSAKRALLVALGEFPVVPVAEREALSAKLLVLYRDDPDSGLHGAIDWLLRQKWGKVKELAAIDAELARESRGRVAARALAGATVPVGLPSGVVGPQLPAPVVAKGKDWFVNGEGQTFAVVRGPVEFTIGSPETEPGRYDDETAHRKRIGRTFAMATKEVTMEQYRRFRPKYEEENRYSKGSDTPAVAMTWYQAAEYCNWLSAREGIPGDQWCYAPNKDGLYAEGMTMKAGHLGLTGYRLPTEVEWEFACRCGAVTARYHGRGEELLPRYGRFVKNGEDHAWPVGGLRPNELGLFDMLGNAMEWVEDPALLYVTDQIEDKENSKYILIDERMSRLLRGGSFVVQPILVRSALRNIYRPGNRFSTVGFRPTRTLP